MNHDAFKNNLNLIFENKISEAAKNVQDMIEEKYQIQISDKGKYFHLSTWQGRKWKIEGFMHADDGYPLRVPGIKPIFAWHSDAPHGYGPLLYDIVMEYATLKGGYFTSTAFGRRLSGLGADEVGHDPTEQAEGVYKYYYERRNDVARTPCPPQLIKKFNFEKQYKEKPYMYQFYQKSPTILTQLVNANIESKSPVLVYGNQRIPYSDLSQLKSDSAPPKPVEEKTEVEDPYVKHYGSVSPSKV